MKDFRFRPQKPNKASIPPPAATKDKEKIWTHLDSDIGIYKVECTSTRSVYIGQSKHLKNRLKTHKNSLKKLAYRYEKPEMQEDYIKFGLDSFIFEVLHNCEEDELYKWETYYCKLYNSEGYKMYNKTINTETTMINCPVEFYDLMNRIVKLLDKGTLSKQDIERTLFFKENYF
jgi:group I intron endonuclease